LERISALIMKGTKLKAAARPAGKVVVPPSKLPPKLSAPKRHGSLIAKGQRSPSEESTRGERRETEIHRTGPRGEVNILRLDGGETMLLEVTHAPYTQIHNFSHSFHFTTLSNILALPLKSTIVP